MRAAWILGLVVLAGAVVWALTRAPDAGPEAPEAREPAVTQAPPVEPIAEPRRVVAPSATVAAPSTSGAIAGRVLTTAGEPIAGATVLAVAQSAGSSRSAATDALGRFELEALTPGPVRVLAHHAGFVAANVAAVATAHAVVDLRLPRQPVLRGRARDRRSGAPVERFAWAVRQEPEEKGLSHAGAGMAAEHPGGRFSATVETSGPHLVVVEAPGYAPAQAVTALAPDTEAEVVLDLDLGVTASGVVLDHDGSPVGDADVQLVPAKGQGMTAQARSAADGTFALPTLPAGRYTARVFHEQRPALAVPDVHLDLRVPEPRLELRLVLGARVHGLVRGHRAGSSAEVMLTHADGAVRRGAVDPQSGAWALERLTPGPHRVEVLTDGNGWRERVARALAREAREPDLVLADGSDTRFDPVDRAVELGVVRGAVRGSAAPEDLVLLARCLDRDLPPVVAGMLRAVPGRDGAFTLDGLPPGRWRLELRRGEVELAWEVVALAPGGEASWYPDLRAAR